MWVDCIVLEHRSNAPFLINSIMASVAEENI